MLIASVVARVAFALVVGTDSGTSDDLRDGLLDHHDVLAVFLVAALIGAPLFEELVFRGVIQRGLTKLTGKYVAIVAQGLLFGFYHVVGAFDLVPGSRDAVIVTRLPPGAYTLVAEGKGAAAGQALIEMVFGIAADRTGRLGPGMLAHFLSNALAMAVLFGMSS